MKIRVEYLPFPEAVRGAVHLCRDGSAIIGINSALDDDERADVLRHEMAHLAGGHFDDPRQIREVEAEASAAG